MIHNFSSRPFQTLLITLKSLHFFFGCIFLFLELPLGFFACRPARMLKLRIHRRITGRVKAFIVL